VESGRRKSVGGGDGGGGIHGKGRGRGSGKLGDKTARVFGEKRARRNERRGRGHMGGVDQLSKMMYGELGNYTPQTSDEEKFKSGRKEKKPLDLHSEGGHSKNLCLRRKGKSGPKRR